MRAGIYKYIRIGWRVDDRNAGTQECVMKLQIIDVQLLWVYDIMTENYFQHSKNTVRYKSFMLCYLTAKILLFLFSIKWFFRLGQDLLFIL